MLRRLLPHSLFAWFALILVAGFALSWIAITAFHAISRDQAVAALEDLRAAERIVAIARFLDHSSPVLRPALADAISGSSLAVNAAQNSLAERARPPDHRTERLMAALSTRLAGVATRELRVDYAKNATAASATNAWWPSLWSLDREERIDRLLSLQSEGTAFVVSMQLMDGSWLNFAFGSVQTLPLSTWPLMAALGLAIATVMALGLAAARFLVRPVDRLAAAAEAMGQGGPPIEVPEVGFHEVRRAARAFNDMRRAIGRMIEDRMAMTGAIAHDLRTPITRLRLRAEFIEDAEQQGKMLADLDQMEAIINSTLEFARASADPEPIASLDLAQLLREAAATHPPAIFPAEGGTPDPAPYRGRKVALKRCLDNLIENALRYGQAARIALHKIGATYEIAIDDDGPGIEPEKLEQVFRPFVRLEPSRNRDWGGAGLGLAIAKQIVTQHGGKIELSNRNEGGLRVLVRLPVT